MNKEEIEKIVTETCDIAIKLLYDKNIDDVEFTLCKNTILATITYFEGKRKDKYNVGF